jgi:transposase
VSVVGGGKASPVFCRQKPAGRYKYLQVVESFRDGGKVRQKVVCTLGRLDRLQAEGNIDGLVKSLSRFALKVRLVEGHKSGRLRAGRAVKIGPAMVAERLWRELRLSRVIEDELRDRKYGFSVERAVFLTVLHRLFAQGSDRAAGKWKRDYRIRGVNDGADSLSLHHLYRAMAWLGEEKDSVEEALFAETRDLFTELSMVFFDTTSIYFEGRGGETLGQYGHSKDHRPDLRQMVVGAALDGEGRPVSCEMWPGNKADAKALVPAIDRLRERFGIARATVVADRGMISRETISELEARKLGYILGARMRRVNEVRREVLARAGRFRQVRENLRVKEVKVEGRRYVVCLNPEEAEKDRADREAILASLEEALKKGPKSLVGNRGYRRYLSVEKGSVTIDRAKVKDEARYDGKFVLRTNLKLDAGEVAVKYKELWRVERAFRTVKSVLETRPIYHKCDETILGHVFASFLALVVMHEMDRRLAARGYRLEWEDVKQDLEALSEVEVFEGEDRYWLRTEFAGCASKVFRALGIAAPPTVRRA